MKKIGYIETDFKTKFGLPRQSGLSQKLTGKIVFEKEYRVREAFKGLEEFSHIWVLWEFLNIGNNGWSPTVRPPLLGGNKRMGVFATRSPNRPNSIGLSCLKLEKISFEKELGPVLYVSGIDMMDKTPIYDIKPYLSYTDAHIDAICGFTEKLENRKLNVKIEQEILEKIPLDKRDELIFSLSSDPRPSYIDEQERIFGFYFLDFEIKFKVSDKDLTVISIKKTDLF